MKLHMSDAEYEAAAEQYGAQYRAELAAMQQEPEPEPEAEAEMG